MADRVRDILLDTSAVVAHLRGRLDIFALTTTEELYLPLVALGELYKGAQRSASPLDGRQRVDGLLRFVGLLLPDRATALVYAKVAAQLGAIGQTIPENDLWIAAVALECDMPLATLDAHFDRVPGLTLIKW